MEIKEKEEWHSLDDEMRLRDTGDGWTKIKLSSLFTSSLSRAQSFGL